jgi:hypothetical protein
MEILKELPPGEDRARAIKKLFHKARAEDDFVTMFELLQEHEGLKGDD